MYMNNGRDHGAERECLRYLLARRVPCDDQSDDQIWETIQEVPVNQLPNLISSPDWRVREGIATRINPNYLPQMMSDEDWHVRYRVVCRIDPDYLQYMARDSDEFIRKEAKARLKEEAKREVVETSLDRNGGTF